MIARALAWTTLKSWIRRPIVWVDLFVLITLLAPQWLFSLAFLRVLRLRTLFHATSSGRPLAADSTIPEWRRPLAPPRPLVTFIFVVTGFVYTSFAGHHVGVDRYLAALYFTVAPLTTTGFGDIVAWSLGHGDLDRDHDRRHHNVRTQSIEHDTPSH